MRKSTESLYGKRIHQATLRYSDVIADCLKLIPGSSIPDKFEYVILFYTKIRGNYLEDCNEKLQAYKIQMHQLAEWKKGMQEEVERGELLISGLDNFITSLSKHHKWTGENNIMTSVLKRDMRGDCIEITYEQALEELEKVGYFRPEAAALLQAGITLPSELYSYEGK